MNNINKINKYLFWKGSAERSNGFIVHFSHGSRIFSVDSTTECLKIFYKTKTGIHAPLGARVLHERTNAHGAVRGSLDSNILAQIRCTYHFESQLLKKWKRLHVKSFSLPKKLLSSLKLVKVFRTIRMKFPSWSASKAKFSSYVWASK